MSEPTRSNEWSLVLFTIALQLSSGLALAATAANCAGDPSNAALMRPVGIAVFPVIAIGLIASLLHLGRPFGAWRSVLNLQHSRLSQEVVLASTFALLALAYSFLWWANITGFRPALGIAASITGLLAIVSSARIYMVPARPLWNSGWLPTSFVGSVLLLGSSAALALARQTPDRVARWLLAAVLAGALLLLLSALWMLLHWSRIRAHSFSQTATRVPFTSGQRFCLGIHFTFAAIAPALLAGYVSFGTTAVPSSLLAIIGVLFAMFGIVAGRLLMYRLPNLEPPF